MYEYPNRSIQIRIMKYFENWSGGRFAALGVWKIAVARILPVGKTRQRDQGVKSHFFFFLLVSDANQFRI